MKSRIHVRSMVVSFIVGFVVLAFSSIITPVQAGTKVLYLTFDDGPSESYTPKVLDILHQEHVKATFFVLGFRAEQYPQLVRRMKAEGHEIGNHGYYHEHIVGKSDYWVRYDVKRTDQVIRKVSGVYPILYRPPGGLIDQHELSMIRQAGHPVVLWTVDSGDWKAGTTKAIVDNVLYGVKPGAIVLFHDGVSNSRYTVEALPTIIHRCRMQGFVFKVLPDHG